MERPRLSSAPLLAAATVVVVVIGVMVAAATGRGEPVIQPSVAPSASPTSAPATPVAGARFGPGANLRVTSSIELTSDWSALPGQTLSIVELRPSVAGRQAYVVQHWGDLVTGLQPETVTATLDTLVVDAATEPVDRGCPSEVSSVEDVAKLEPWNRLACFRDQRVVLPQVRRETYAVMDGNPPWLAGSAGVDFPIALPFAEADGVSVPKGRWLDVTGHFDDARCDDGDLRCRQRMVVTGFADAAPPASEWAGSWRALPDAPIPVRSDAVATWTGQEVVIWGGYGPSAANEGDPSIDPRVGAAYDSAADRWRLLPPSPIEATTFATAVWTGREVIVWGGTTDVTTWSPAGAAYDPAADRWRRLPDAPFGSSSAAWTGSRFVIVGPDGRTASYDPGSDGWSAPSTPLATSPGSWSVVALDDTALTFHAVDGLDAAVEGWRSDDNGSTWRPLAPTAWRAVEAAEPVVGDDRMYALGQYASEPEDGLFGSVAYEPETDTWLPLGPCGLGLAPVWTGGHLLGTRAAYDPIGDTCLTLPTPPDRPGMTHPDREAPVAVWTGSDYVLWGGGTIIDGPATLGDGVAFRPDRP